MKFIIIAFLCTIGSIAQAQFYGGVDIRHTSFPVMNFDDAKTIQTATVPELSASFSYLHKKDRLSFLGRLGVHSFARTFQASEENIEVSYLRLPLSVGAMIPAKGDEIFFKLEAGYYLSFPGYIESPLLDVRQIYTAHGLMSRMSLEFVLKGGSIASLGLEQTQDVGVFSGGGSNNVLFNDQSIYISLNIPFKRERE